MKAIETKQLTKHYGETVALSSLDLAVEQGEVFGFLGPNGAGKTTMMRTILDLIRPTSGSASIMGLDTQADALKIRKHIGYLPGELAMYGSLTGRQLIEYFANLRGGVDVGYVDELAARLNADLSVKIRDYSTGNKQKVGLIQALMNKPDVVLLDEPSTGLDPLVQKEFQSILRETAAEGRTVFLSSHTLSEVNNVADRIAIIRHGKLIVTESMTELKKRALRKLSFIFQKEPPSGFLDAIDGVQHVEAQSTKVSLSFSGDMSELLKACASYDIAHLESGDADLEDIFLAYYRDDNVAADGAQHA